MNRYVFYLIIVFMITNIPISLPKVLLMHSHEGAIISMLLAVITGVLITYFIVTLFNQFPGKGLPELLKDYTSKWFYIPTILFFSASWFTAGLITLIKYSFLIITFLTPEISIYTIVLSFLLIIPYGVLMKTKSVLYLVEIVLILLLPIFIFIVLKTYTSRELDWDYVKVAMMHINNYPNYDSLTSSTFIFLGVINLTIYNRYFLKKQTLKAKHLVSVGVIGLFILFTTYFIPIAVSGFDKIELLNYPWISTSDAIRMKFGFIERLEFIFLSVFLSMAFLSIIVHWHGASQFLNSIVTIKRLKWKDKNLTPHLFVGIFALIGIISTKNFSEHQLFKVSILFYNSMPLLLLMLFISMLAVKKGVKS